MISRIAFLEISVSGEDFFMADGYNDSLNSNLSFENQENLKNLIQIIRAWKECELENLMMQMANSLLNAVACKLSGQNMPISWTTSIVWIRQPGDAFNVSGVIQRAVWAKWRWFSDSARARGITGDIVGMLLRSMCRIDVDWLFVEQGKEWVVEVEGIFGPPGEPDTVQSTRALNRHLIWATEGVAWECDPRRVDVAIRVVVRDMAKGAQAPCERRVAPLKHGERYLRGNRRLAQYLENQEATAWLDGRRGSDHAGAVGMVSRRGLGKTELIDAVWPWAQEAMGRLMVAQRLLAMLPALQATLAGNEPSWLEADPAVPSGGAVPSDWPPGGPERRPSQADPAVPSGGAVPSDWPPGGPERRPSQATGAPKVAPHLPPWQPFHERYVLLGKLGKGAFASVYLTRPATGPPDGPHCVVKVIQLQAQPRPGHLAAQASEARPPGPLINAKLKRAAEKEASFLKHVGGLEHCVSAFDFAIEGTLAYIVMERCDLTLLRLLEQLPSLREASLARIFSEMCQALASIHGLGIVHRDIKPDNFLCVGEASTIKLCDFGLAEGESRGSDQGLTGVYGTAPFMSPEMLSGTGYDSKTDLWSLGVIMYVICLGQFPYIPAKTSASAMKAAILVGVPAPSFRPKTSLDLSNGSPISECLKDLIRELLERDCAARATADHALRHEWFSPGAERSWWIPAAAHAVFGQARGRFRCWRCAGGGRAGRRAQGPAGAVPPGGHRCGDSLQAPAPGRRPAARRRRERRPPALQRARGHADGRALRPSRWAEREHGECGSVWLLLGMAFVLVVSVSEVSWQLRPLESRVKESVSVWCPGSHSKGSAACPRLRRRPAEMETLSRGCRGRHGFGAQSGGGVARASGCAEAEGCRAEKPLSLSSAAELRELCGVVFITFLLDADHAVVQAAKQAGVHYHQEAKRRKALHDDGTIDDLISI
ncbi:unnamed protein product [Prorocentrum cordatum]|uniref:Protein kinase domain-containing protein n=1 Tax=Prorocentrum cordatum TaxID=2364126 RepID=A0ABN9W572_9DINO|nr:unnamed protein product [Polarella glacialis]